jgi:hypothetical protein
VLEKYRDEDADDSSDESESSDDEYVCTRDLDRGFRLRSLTNA